MADFVRDDVAQHLAHDLLRQRQLLRARIERPDLGEIPGLGQAQHVVPEDRVRGNHFAAARVDHRRAHRVLAAARRPAHDVVAHVLRIPVRVLLRRRRIARDDGIAEPGFLEHLLPVLDAALDVGAPLVGHFVAQIEHDRLHRFGYLGRGILLLQPVALDVGAAHPAVLPGAVVVERHGEIANAVIRIAPVHRLLRQHQHAG